MSFFPDMSQKRLVPPAGSPSSRIAIVGDFVSQYDARSLRPFNGPDSGVLEQCLHGAGLIRGEVYLTNLFKEVMMPAQKQQVYKIPGKQKQGKLTEASQPYVAALRSELAKGSANVVVACGPAAYAALCGRGSISKHRGYVFSADLGSRRVKVIPTFHPLTTVRGGYINRHLMVEDFKKAKYEGGFAELKRPQRTLMWEYNGLPDVLQVLDAIAKAPAVAYDIEVLHYETSMISLANSPSMSIVIPFDDRWSVEEEGIIWRRVQKILGNPDTLKIAQNCIFDNQFMLTHDGIVIRGEVHDTMIGHSCMYPDFQKGLGFLGSLYCGSQAFWKDSVKFNDVKGDS